MESPIRRVLGDKDVNASLSPAKHLSSKPSDLKSFGPIDNNQSCITSPPESKKRPLEVTMFPAPVAPDASEEHASKRPKSSTAQPPHIEAPQTSVAMTGPKSNDKVRQSPIADPVISEIAIENPTSQDLDETASQAATIAECASEPSLAEQLRLRLRVAMFKVKTDQASAPMSRLEISPAPTRPPRQKTELFIKDPPEDLMRKYRHRPTRPYQYRRQSRPLGPRRSFEPSREQQTLDLMLPSVSYAPFDARLPVHPDQDTSRRARYVRSSSPACSDCGSHGRAEEEDAGPATPSSMARSERSGSPGVLRTLPTPHFKRPLEQDLTSSAIKGNAADSLLRLGGS